VRSDSFHRQDAPRLAELSCDRELFVCFIPLPLIEGRLGWEIGLPPKGGSNDVKRLLPLEAHNATHPSRPHFLDGL
jgi:hypothetical protein